MPSIMSPCVAPNVPTQPSLHTAPRGRPTEEAQGRSFGETLERSRAASAMKPQENPESLPLLEPLARHNDKLNDKLKPSQSGRSGDKKDDLPADLQAMALLALIPAPISPDSRTSSTSPQDDNAAGRSMAQVSQVTTAVAQSPLSGNALARAAVAPVPNLLPKTAITVSAAQAMALQVTPISQQEALLQANAAQLDRTQDLGRTSPVEATLVSGDRAQATADMRRAPVQGAMSTESKTLLDTRFYAPFAAFDEHLDPANTAGALASPPTLALMSVMSATPVMPAATDRPSAPVGQTPALSVAPVVGGSEWGPALGQQMIRMSTSGHHVAELSLNPAGLGPLKVTLSIGDNQAQALFVSAHEGVRNAIEAALPQLRKTLADHGINLAQTSVGAESQQQPRQGGTFGQRPSGRSAPSDYTGPGRLDTIAIAEPLRTGLPSAPRRPGASVDIFA